MKEYFLSSSINLINQFNKNYSIEQTEKLKYGLEGIYLTITKLIIIIVLSLIIGILKEVLFVLFFFNIIRYSAFGIHMSKSSTCLILSILLFVGLTYILTLYNINIIYKIIICIISFISYVAFAPADTPKRPLTNAKKRKYRKIISCMISIIYIVLIFNSKNQLLSNLITLSMFIESILINPIIYKLFNIPFKNYKKVI